MLVQTSKNPKKPAKVKAHAGPSLICWNNSSIMPSDRPNTPCYPSNLKKIAYR